MSEQAKGLLLVGRSRFAGIPRLAAAAMLSFIILFCWRCFSAHDMALAATSLAPGEIGDQALYRLIVDHVRSGQTYYDAASQALRDHGYPLRPFVAVRLPTLAVLQAAVPGWAVLAAGYALLGAIVLVWMVRLRDMFSGVMGTSVALALLLCGLITPAAGIALLFHEAWAGMLIALALGLRTRERWLPSVLIGLLAIAIRETSILFLIVMAFCAWQQRARAEAIAWTISILALAGVLALHAHAVATVLLPGDRASPGWMGLNGLDFFAAALATFTVLTALPSALASLLVGLALCGLLALRGDLADRLILTIFGYACAIAMFARVDNFYWVLIVTPLSLVGLAAVPDMLRDLLTALIAPPGTVKPNLGS